MHGFQAIAKTHDAHFARNKVDVKILVIRIPEAHSDVCIYFNAPVELSNESSSAALGTRTLPPFTKDEVMHILESFRVVNWELFGIEQAM